jgi:murein DD-endopeptidase MepM/ murein hydrolase activator NlpD
MRSEIPPTRIGRRPTLVALAIAGIGAAAMLLAGVVSAPAQDLQGQLDEKQAELDQALEQKGVLTTEIGAYNADIEQLSGEVALLRNREAAVEAELAEVQTRLEQEVHYLALLRERLQRSLRVLENRLIAIYKANPPDTLTVILEADGFEDLLDRYEYLQRIENRDSEIITRVRDLRDQTEATVERIRATRDEIAAKEAELERTRVELEQQEAALEEARDKRQNALSQVEGHIERLEGNIDDLDAQIQEQLSAATGALPAGPTSSSGFIWPVNGPVTSGFGMRWGRMHEGIDIAVPSGTPIRAAAGGTVAIAAPTGGYGNYTCVNHSAGLSTCYAHQSSYAVGVGESVSQGEVIGSVGCTGSCFGDHLHFEVRVNGAAVDPMGYL